MIKGKENPIITIGNTSIDLPTPVRNGRENEKEEDITERFTNILGQRRQKRIEYRFSAEYNFGKVDVSLVSQLQQLLDIYKNKCTFIPYSDIELQHYRCLAKIHPRNLNGKVEQKSLRMEVQQIGTMRGRTSRDSIYIITTHPKKIGEL